MVFINDPRTLVNAPYIVLSDITNDLVASLIKVRTNGNYNHVMTSIKQGELETQGGLYKTLPMDAYMKKGHRLKFYTLNVSPDAIQSFMADIQKELAAPFWQRWYDWIGILGQAIGQEWFNTPGLKYCSERVIGNLYAMLPYLTDDQKKIVLQIQGHWNPDQLDVFLQHNPTVFIEYGKWESDDDVVV